VPVALDVVGEDLVLVLLLRELDREEGLLELAHVVGGGSGGVVALGVLLRDRRATLAGAVAEVGPERTGHAGHGDAGVLVEGAVLGGDDRVADDLRDLLGGDELTVRLVDEAAHDGLAVGVVDGRRLADRDARRLGDGRGRVCGDDDADDDGEHEQEAAEEEAPGRQPAAHGPLARTRIVDEPALGRTSRRAARGGAALRG